MAVDDTVTRALNIAVASAWAKGGSNFVALDVSENLVLTDAFLIVTGRNERNTKAIADSIEDDLHDAGVKLHRKEGKADGRWILLDFGFLVVHVFHEEERLYYQLERLWRDCPLVALPDGLGLENDSNTQEGL